MLIAEQLQQSQVKGQRSDLGFGTILYRFLIEFVGLISDGTPHMEYLST